jgi:hypothetical protein
MIVEPVLLSDRGRMNCTGELSLDGSICRGHNDQLDLVNDEEGEEDFFVETSDETKEERTSSLITIGFGRPNQL